VGTTGRDDDSRLDINRELSDVREPLLYAGNDEVGMEDEDDERARGTAAASSSE
jgi:hypothetical protein